MNNFVFPEELTYFVESLRPFQLLQVGTPKWLDVHELVLKLSQQAILEVMEQREEAVKECLIERAKLPLLVQEAHCVRLWKTFVLPHLLEIDPNPSATFLIYTVLFHEGACVALLDAALFHSAGCETLQSAAIDLVDYCAQALAQLIGLVSMGDHENETRLDVDESVLSELERQKRDLLFKIGLRCISILGSLADNAAALNISAQRRMLVTHDLPWLLADLLHFRPWQRRGPKGFQKFIDEKWTYVAAGDKATQVVKQEAQAWFCLRQLLFNNTLMQSYEMHEQRRQHLAKCQGLLHECILDQLPPLIELKEYLCRLSVAGAGAGAGSNGKTNLLLEELPEISDNLIKEAERAGGYCEIAQQQESIFLHHEKEKILETAQRLNAAYNTDLWAELEQQSSTAADVQTEDSSGTKQARPDDPIVHKKCGNCRGAAEKKCANCKTAFYCSRKCQLDDWPKHKVDCLKMRGD